MQNLSFLKAEAAVKGWGSDAEGNSLNGVQGIFGNLGVGDTIPITLPH